MTSLFVINFYFIVLAIIACDCYHNYNIFDNVVNTKIMRRTKFRLIAQFGSVFVIIKCAKLTKTFSLQIDYNVVLLTLSRG